MAIQGILNAAGSKTATGGYGGSGLHLEPGNPEENAAAVSGAHDPYPVNDATQPGIAAVKGALGAVSDPNRFAASNQARAVQNGVANYYAGVASGQSPLIATLQRRQQQDQSIGAMQSQYLAGGAPPSAAGALLNAQSQAQGGAINTAQSAATQEQGHALGSTNQAAGNMRANDINQTLGTGAQVLQGAGNLSGLYSANAGRSMSANVGQQQAYVQGRGQDMAHLQNAADLAERKRETQTEYEQNNDWWHKYGLPAVHGTAAAAPAVISAVAAA